MNAEVKEKWVAALRSGEYQQTKYRLKQRLPDGTFGYCCLGVLCEITGLPSRLALTNDEGAEDAPLASPETWEYYIEGESRCSSMASLPRPLAQALDIHMTSTVMSMNDHGRTFQEIADVIEESE